MGFSVTAAHVIFFVAFLGAASVGMSSYWSAKEDLEEARRVEIDRVDKLVHGEMSLAVTACTGSCNAGTRQVTIEITNGGTTVFDVTKLVYVIDGRTYTWSSVSSASITAPASVANTEILLPGETLRVIIPNAVLGSNYTTSSLPVQAVSEEGVIGRR